MNKKAKWILAIALLSTGLLALAGCSGGTHTSGETGMADAKEENNTVEYKKITPEQAKARMDSGDDIIILDVRTVEEYAENHVPGTIVIPVEEIGTEPIEQMPDLDQEILVYCRSGNRSAEAAKKLIAIGYTNVFDFGGIVDWPYDTESGIAAG